MGTILDLIAGLLAASPALFAAPSAPAMAESSAVGNLKAHKDFKLEAKRHFWRNEEAGKLLQSACGFRLLSRPATGGLFIGSIAVGLELPDTVSRIKVASWGSICFDPKGKLIVGDQNGELCRFIPPPVCQSGEIKSGVIDLDIGPGSPTGVALGYGAQFPPKYRKPSSSTNGVGSDCE